MNIFLITYILFCILRIAFYFAVSEISGPTRTQTAWPTFYDEEDEVVYGSAEMDRTENRPLAVDNTVHGHVGYPSLVTPSSTIRVGKKRPAINAKSAGADSHRRRLSITDVLSPLVSLTIICRSWWWWWW